MFASSRGGTDSATAQGATVVNAAVVIQITHDIVVGGWTMRGCCEVIIIDGFGGS